MVLGFDHITLVGTLAGILGAAIIPMFERANDSATEALFVISLGTVALLVEVIICCLRFAMS